MKNSYIGPLVILFLLCGAVAGGLIYLVSESISSIQVESKKIEELKNQESQLERDRSAIEATAGSDERYREYFIAWERSGAVADEVALKTVLAQMAQEVGVRLSEEAAPLIAPTATANAMGDVSRAGLPSRGFDDIMGREGRRSLPRSSMPQSSSDTISVVLVGDFMSLLKWISVVEAKVGNVKITKTQWVARSVEEVNLSVSVEYRRVR